MLQSGYFTLFGRLISATFRMMTINIAGVIVGVIVLGILNSQKVVTQDASAIELTAIIITNIIYETFLMFLMGYGLIELPRSVWLSASLDSALLRAQMRACADFKDISNAQISMGLCVANVIKTKNDVSLHIIFILFKFKRIEKKSSSANIHLYSEHFYTISLLWLNNEIFFTSIFCHKSVLP